MINMKLISGLIDLPESVEEEVIRLGVELVPTRLMKHSNQARGIVKSAVARCTIRSVSHGRGAQTSDCGPAHGARALHNKGRNLEEKWAQSRIISGALVRFRRHFGAPAPTNALEFSDTMIDV